MRILHFADLHLGVETYGKIDPATGLSSRLNDFLDALDELVDFALNENVDLVLFCGDAYKNRDPGQTYQREFARRIKRLSDGDVAIFLLAGNHDLHNAVGRATSVEIFDTLAISNVTVANQPETYLLKTKNGALQIVALPWVRRSKLLTKDDMKNLPPDQINRILEERLINWINAKIEDLDPALPAILAGHLSHSSAMPGTERSMLVGRDYVLPLGNIANPAFDYVALGHIHNKQIIEYPVPVVYSGSLQSIDFGDEGQDKGFFLIELNEAANRSQRLQSYDFCPVKARRFVTVDVDADTDDPMSAVTRAIEKKDIKDAIVRLHIKVSAEKEGYIHDNEIRKLLQDTYFVAAVHKDVAREHRPRLGDHSVEVLTPLEALKLYFEINKTSEQRARVLLEYGERLIQQGHIDK